MYFKIYEVYHISVAFDKSQALFTRSVKNFVRQAYFCFFSKILSSKKAQNKNFQRSSKKQKKKLSAYETFYATGKGSLKPYLHVA